MSSKKKALIIGASGLVGGCVLRLLLRSGDYEEVRVLSRRALPTKGIDKKTLQESIIDFDELQKVPVETFHVDDVFSCLGTTMRKTASLEAYRKIEIDYPLALAELTAAHGAKSFHYVSSLGANSKSLIPYSRIKGEAEEALRGVQKKYPSMSIVSYRPSFILGKRENLRVAESLVMPLLKILEPALCGNLKKYRSIHAESIAKGMFERASHPKQGFWFIESDKIVS